MRFPLLAIVCLLVHPVSTSAEVTKVTVTSRTVVAGGQSFGSTGPYEKLMGRIEFTVGYLLQEDMENVFARAYAHWDYATRTPASSSRS